MTIVFAGWVFGYLCCLICFLGWWIMLVFVLLPVCVLGGYFWRCALLLLFVVLVRRALVRWFLVGYYGGWLWWGGVWLIAVLRRFLFD